MNFLQENIHSRIGRAVHAVSWLAGGLYLTTPFNLFWKLGNGSLGYNMLITLALSLIGIAVSVSITRRIRKCIAALDEPLRGRLAVMACLPHLIAICGCLGALFLHWPPWVAVGGTIFSALLLAGALIYLSTGSCRASASRRSWSRWMVRRWHFNGVFWLCVFILLAAPSTVSGNNISISH